MNIKTPEYTLHDALASPLIVTEDMDEGEFLEAIGGMAIRACALSNFLAGKLNWDDYLEACHQTGVDAVDFHSKIIDGVYLL